MGLFKKKKPELHSVLFVCSANVTRSPAVEALFKKHASKSIKSWNVGSAGTKAGSGSAPNPVVAYILFQRGVNINSHRSKPVTPRLLRRYYWIIVMEKAHRQAITEMEPDSESRVFVMRELIHGNRLNDPNMPDPTGKEVDDYRELFDILDQEIPQLVKILQNKASDTGWEKEAYTSE